MTVEELKEELEHIIADGNGHLPVSFFANNQVCMSDEMDGSPTINLCEVDRIDKNRREYQKKFVLIGNYWGSTRSTFTEILNYRQYPSTKRCS